MDAGHDKGDTFLAETVSDRRGALAEDRRKFVMSLKYFFVIPRALRGSGHFSRVRSGQDDPARPVRLETVLTRPDPTRPDPWDFEHLLTRPGDSTRETMKMA